MKRFLVGFLAFAGLAAAAFAVSDDKNMIENESRPASREARLSGLSGRSLKIAYALSRVVDSGDFSAAGLRDARRSFDFRQPPETLLGDERAVLRVLCGPSWEPVAASCFEKIDRYPPEAGDGVPAAALHRARMDASKSFAPLCRALARFVKASEAGLDVERAIADRAAVEAALGVRDADALRADAVAWALDAGRTVTLSAAADDGAVLAGFFRAASPAARETALAFLKDTAAENGAAGFAAALRRSHAVTFDLALFPFLDRFGNSDAATAELESWTGVPLSAMDTERRRIFLSCLRGLGPADSTADRYARLWRLGALDYQEAVTMAGRLIADASESREIRRAAVEYLRASGMRFTLYLASNLLRQIDHDPVLGAAIIRNTLHTAESPLDFARARRGAWGQLPRGEAERAELFEPFIDALERAKGADIDIPSLWGLPPERCSAFRLAVPALIVACHSWDNAAVERLAALREETDEDTRLVLVDCVFEVAAPVKAAEIPACADPDSPEWDDLLSDLEERRNTFTAGPSLRDGIVFWARVGGIRRPEVQRDALRIMARMERTTGE